MKQTQVKKKCLFFFKGQINSKTIKQAEGQLALSVWPLLPTLSPWWTLIYPRHFLFITSNDPNLI